MSMNKIKKLSEIISNSDDMDEFEQKLSKDYEETIKNEKLLNFASEYLFEELIDDIILSISFESHFELKNLDIEKEEEKNDSIENDEKMTDIELKQNNGDTSSSNKKNKLMYCNCSNCQKVVAVTKFASHLEQCMGIGRKVRLRKRKDITY